MERASSFTAVPGLGGAAMGVTALVAAAVSLRARTPDVWLGIWLAEACVAVVDRGLGDGAQGAPHRLGALLGPGAGDSC